MVIRRETYRNKFTKIFLEISPHFVLLISVAYNSTWLHRDGNVIFVILSAAKNISKRQQERWIRSLHHGTTKGMPRHIPRPKRHHHPQKSDQFAQEHSRAFREALASHSCSYHWQIHPVTLRTAAPYHAKKRLDQTTSIQEEPHQWPLCSWRVLLIFASWCVEFSFMQRLTHLATTCNYDSAANKDTDTVAVS